jgi:hypothetical protein
MIAGRLVIDLEGFTLDAELERDTDAEDADEIEAETLAEERGGMGFPAVFISTKSLGTTSTKGLAIAKVAKATRERKICIANLAI